MLSVEWITATLQTIKSKTLQHITLYPATTAHMVEDAVYEEWQELDCLLVQLWTLHPIRLQLMYRMGEGEGERDLRDHILSLLPELSRRGLVDLVEGTD